MLSFRKVLKIFDFRLVAGPYALRCALHTWSSLRMGNACNLTPQNDTIYQTISRFLSLHNEACSGQNCSESHK